MGKNNLKKSGNQKKCRQKLSGISSAFCLQLNFLF